VPDADVRSTDLRKGEGDGTVRRSWRHAAMRWSGAERIAGGACLLLITLFLPWWGVAVLGARQVDFAGLSDGMAWVVLIAALAVLAFLVLCAGSAGVRFARPPGGCWPAPRRSISSWSCWLFSWSIPRSPVRSERPAAARPDCRQPAAGRGRGAARRGCGGGRGQRGSAARATRPRRAAGEPTVIRVPAVR
jgi:hypothetical protein